jgi:hypothetical protein
MAEVRITRILKARWTEYLGNENVKVRKLTERFNLKPGEWRARGWVYRREIIKAIAVPFKNSIGAECAYLYAPALGQWSLLRGLRPHNVTGKLTGERTAIHLSDIPEIVRDEIQDKTVPLLLALAAREDAQKERKAASKAARPSRREVNAQRARDGLERWERKLKLAETKVKAYRAKVRRYGLAAAKRDDLPVLRHRTRGSPAGRTLRRSRRGRRVP